MISLLIDTCTKNVCIALFKDKTLMDKVVYSNQIDLSSNFMVLINNIFTKNNVKIEDVDKFFVAVGPGSFTGIRIGVTCAKVMAWSLKKDVTPFSSLELLATVDSNNDYIVPLIDARRGYVFAGIYDNHLNCITNDAYIKLDDLLEKIENDKSTTYVSLDNFDLETILPEYNVNKIIEKHFNDTPINPHSLNPNYLKKTEAEEKRESIND